MHDNKTLAFLSINIYICCVYCVFKFNSDISKEKDTTMKGHD